MCSIYEPTVVFTPTSVGETEVEWLDLLITTQGWTHPLAIRPKPPDLAWLLGPPGSPPTRHRIRPPRPHEPGRDARRDLSARRAGLEARWQELQLPGPVLAQSACLEALAWIRAGWGRVIVRSVWAPPGRHRGLHNAVRRFLDSPSACRFAALHSVAPTSAHAR